MGDTPGPIDQTINDGRLTLKKPYLDFLGNPSVVDVTYGPGVSILIHNPERRQKYLDQLLPPPGSALDNDEDVLERRLGSGKRSTPVDDQGRMRIEQVYLKWAGLTAKSQAYLMPRERDGWIEVWNEEGYFSSLRGPDEEDPFTQARNNIIQRSRSASRRER